MAAFINVGDIVRSSRNQQWGRGKVVALDRGKVFVAFENEGGATAKRLLPPDVQVLPGEVVPLLEFLPPFKPQGNDYVLDQRRRSMNELIAHFISLFPRRFEDPAYIGQGGRQGTGERAYKLDAHNTFAGAFGNGRAEQMIAAKQGTRIAETIRSVLAKQNLLATQEQIALTDALADPDAALRYLSALVEYLSVEPTASSFRSYAAAVDALPKRGQFRVATWPVATLLPFLSLRWGHMFLKPEVTKEAAAIMGVELNYDSALNWTTYDRLLALTRQLTSVLAPLGARDTIDVQSFIWVALEYP